MYSRKTRLKPSQSKRKPVKEGRNSVPKGDKKPTGTRQVKLLVDADYVVYKCCAANKIDWGMM